VALFNAFFSKAAGAERLIRVTVRCLVSERVVTPDGIGRRAVLVEGERIVAVVPPGEIPVSAKIHDFGRAAILPGLVDSHVHINEPGRTEWEGFETATRAAAAGGYTMLIDMPLNCLPATTDVAALEEKRAAARGKCRVDWGAWGGVVADNPDDIEPLAAAGVLGFKCFMIHAGIDGFTMVTEPQLRAALPRVAKTKLPLLVHAELSGPVDAATAELRSADWRIYDTYLKSRPDEAELSAIHLLISLCREFGFRLHIVHLSTSEGIALVQAARAEGLPVTVETCPHYLYACAEKIANGATLWKCAPPIRNQANREKLWQGLRDGVIDLIATDHSPCPPHMKKLDEGNFKTAWGGIASLPVALSVLWTEAARRGFTLADIARWMAERPARLAGCDQRKGEIAPGYDADFVVFDPEGEFVVARDQLHQRHPISPYVGERLRGAIKATYLRGEPVYEDGEFPGEPLGTEYSP
jgi:allantoinase